MGSKADAQGHTYIQPLEVDRPEWTLTAPRSQNPSPMPKLTPYDLEVIERACRSVAAIMERDTHKIDNPTVRGPVERMAHHAAALAERFAKARKVRSA